jgi:serine/threonine protein kinase
MERFGQFEIVRPLGVGGMAETALAVRRGEGEVEQRVCLKRILPAFSRDPEFVRAFQAEARLGMRMVHPHVCRLYDFGNQDGTFWMSMEYLDGGDLRSLLENLETLSQPIPIDVVLLLALDIASALHYAHELRVDGRAHEIVHRDISPSNVLIDATGHFKLADFGIAKASAGGEVTRTGVVKGKIPYMSPEHARGSKIDGRADLWSFGVLLYEALAGQRPFRGSHEVETLLAVTEGRRQKLLEVAPHTPPLLAQVVENLLEPDLAKRTAKAADVIEALASTPPPANARLRLASLIQHIHDETRKTDQRAIGDAVTAFAPDGATGASPEPTMMAKDGVAAGVAKGPVSASPHDATRAATPVLAAMDTKAIVAPEATIMEVAERGLLRANEPRSSEPRASEALPSSSSASLAPPMASLTDTEAVVVPSTGVRRSAQIVIAFAAMGTLGLGLLAWGAAGGSPTSAASTGASGAVAPAVVDVPTVPTTALPSVLAATSPVTAPVTGPITAPPTAVVAEARIEAPTADPSEPSGEPASDPNSDATTPIPAAAGSDTEATASEHEATAERGTLVMAATPWGNIWLDGRRLGMGPVTRRVSPGRHTVGAGNDRPTSTRTVQVEPGQRLEVALRVGE